MPPLRSRPHNHIHYLYNHRMNTDRNLR
jgi:hypothetical protein